jgi:3-oxoacyl-[acyl-carrier-protein] synthase-3
MHSKIKAISVYLPEVIVTNEDLCKENPNFTPELLFKKTGVRSRRNIPLTMPPSDYALLSFQKFCLENPWFDKNDVDFIIHCSEGFDYRSPSTAGIIQKKAGMRKQAGAMDLLLSCSGYTYGLLLAHSLIISKQCKNVLFIAQAVPNWVIHKDDIEMRALFGDASSCTLISESDTPGIGNFAYGSDGTGEKALRVIKSGCSGLIDANWFDEQKDYLPHGRMEMNGLEILSFSLETVPPLVEETLRKNNLVMDDIQLFCLHQASTFLLKSLRRKMKIPDEKFIIDMEFTGNTVAASIPICLVNCMEKSLVKKGDKVLIAGYGSGFSWAATVLTI